jgi:hypothetical protein
LRRSRSCPRHYVEWWRYPALGLRSRARRPDTHGCVRSPKTDAEAGRARRDRRPDTGDVPEAADTPALRFLGEHGTYRRAASTFPSLTPVCLSSIATGAHPDVHEIPHLVWWYRKERRIVEYGSSFGAVRAAGLARSLRDTIIDLNAKHLGKGAQTIYEQLEGEGLTTGAINITLPRPHRHLPTIPGVPAVYGRAGSSSTRSTKRPHRRRSPSATARSGRPTRTSRSSGSGS